MKILRVTPSLPFPPTSGGKLRAYNLLKGFGRRHDVTLVALHWYEPDEEHVASLRDYCEQIFVVPIPRRPIATALRNSLRLSPYHVTAYRSAKAARIVADLLAAEHFDVMHTSFAHLLQYAAPPNGVCQVLEQHNADRLVWERLARGSGSAFARAACRVNYWKTKWYEQRSYRNLDLVFSVTPEDAAITRGFADPRVRIEVAPNGVDVDYFSPAQGVEPRSNVIAICGGMDQVPTEDSVIHFVDDILPRIQASLPEVKLWLVGRDPSRRIRKLGERPDVTVTGTVPDVRPYMAEATLVVAAQRMGGGMKHKIANAMAMGKAVVTTPIGAQGYDFRPGEIVIEDDQFRLAQEILRLLQNTAARQEMERRARAAMVTRHSWIAIVDRMDAIMQEQVKVVRSVRRRV